MYPSLPQLHHTDTDNFFLLAGPCVVEDHENPFVVCERLTTICNRLHIPFAFKASYRKANRSSFPVLREKRRKQALAASQRS